MLKNKKVVLLLLLAVAFLLSPNFSKEYKVTKIEKVLNNKYYSYLPVEAKEFVREVYEEKGEVVLTEKNKKKNKPYLNPKYVSYLAMSSEKRAEVDLIPKSFIIDYSSDKVVESTGFPSYYNISNINGNSYITPINDQDQSGLCWAFTSIEQAESMLMTKSHTPYNGSNARFSVRQLDYATSVDGINNYINENTTNRYLYTGGGNYLGASYVMSLGKSLTNYNDWQFNTSTDKKELNQVLNFANSSYELKGSIMLPELSSTSTSTDRETFNNNVKDLVINNGGAYVGTESPQGSCGFINTDGKYTVVDQSYCAGSAGHAMQIIGWDDNYSYKYCKKSNMNVSTNNGTCESGTLTTGKGAWLLRNSWGNQDPYRFVYLSYDSYNFDVEFATDLERMSNRNWDNVHHKNMWRDGMYYSTLESSSFSKTINTPEKIEYIKFMPYSSNGNYNIYISSDSFSDNIVKNVNTTYPGIYTIDFSNDNIVLNDKDFSISIRSSDGSTVWGNSISVFTSNVNDTPVISTNNLSSEEADRTSNNDYSFIAYSSTKNINSNSTVNYSLYQGNNDKSNLMKSISNNIVSENNVNATIVIDKDIPDGEYTLITKYGHYSYDSKITIVEKYQLQGSGTVSDPYRIYNENDLGQMRNNLSAYYKLQNDITLSKDWVPVGTALAPFRGGFDGNNYKINNLNVNSTDDKPAGLFGYVLASYSYDCQINGSYTTTNNKTYFKNIILNNSYIENFGISGGLVGELVFDANDPPENCFNQGNPIVNIDNIKIINGSVISNDTDAGAIIGTLTINAKTFNKPELNINNLYSSATVAGVESTGLIGYINDTKISGSGIMLNLNMENFQNAGVMDVVRFNQEYNHNNFISPVIGGLTGNIGLKLENYIINSVYNNPKYLNDIYEDKFYREHNHNYYIMGYLNDYYSPNYTVSATNGYCFTKYTYLSTELNNPSNYSSWNNFSTYWDLKTNDSINRIPVIKGIDFPYTRANDFTISKNEEVYLSNYIGPKFYPEDIEFNIKSGNDVIRIDGVESNGDDFYDNYIIKGLKPGTAIITLSNHYDGFVKDITVTVNNSSVQKITYYKNDGSNESTSQQVNTNQSFKLNKNTFTRTGYKFNNWNSLSNGSGISYNDENTFASGIDDDLDLYAIWSPIKYNIAYNSNGGAGTMQTQQLTYDTPATLSNNTFTRTNFIFKEWNTNANGSGTKYNNGASVLNLSSTENATITLYAIWIPSKYTVTFNTNGGSSISPVTVDYNTKLSKPTDPIRDGYTFGGWYTNSSLTNVFDFNTLIDHNFTLYAKWIKKPTSIPVYRMYNPRTGEHLYTADAHEVDVIYKTLGWGFEGVGWYTIDSGTPVYRLYSPKFDNHLYTSDQNEMNIITSRYGWIFDNVRNGVPQPVMYSNGDTKIYRLYNPGQNDQHHLTTDYNEYTIIPKWGWRQEGVAMKASSLGIPVITYYYKNSHRDIDFVNIRNNKL